MVDNIEQSKNKKISKPRQFQGVVVSIVEKKTIHVLVHRVTMDKKYRKQFKETKKYAVHDELGLAKVDDVVTFAQCRPLSKTKKWRLVNKLVI